MSTETLTIGKALNLGLRRAMEDDDKVLLMGEDIGRLGGVFRITDGLQKDFGEDRVVDTPLAEADELAARIRSGTLDMTDPPGTAMFDFVYAEQTPELAAQRAEFVEYHASFADGGHGDQDENPGPGEGVF